MRHATITNGTVGVPRPANEAEPGAVPIPDHVMLGDTFADGKFYRNSVELIQPPRIWSVLDFLAKFTPEEEATVRTNAPYIHTMLLAAHEVNSEDPLTQYAFAQLVVGGILTQERVNQVLEIA